MVAKADTEDVWRETFMLSTAADLVERGGHPAKLTKRWPDNAGFQTQRDIFGVAVYCIDRL